MKHSSSRRVIVNCWTTNNLRLQFLLAIIVLCCSEWWSCHHNANALVVTSQPSTHSPTVVKQQDDSSRKRQTMVRIRTMREADLPAVSSLLAYEIVGQSAASAATGTAQALAAWNLCKAHMEQIRQKSLLETELRHRLQAIQEGRKVWSKLELQNNPTHRRQRQGQSLLSQHDAKSEQQLLRWLWSHETFRSKLQCAVQLHQQQQQDGENSCNNNNPHFDSFCWKEHDMNLIPSDARWLQHVMMVAEELSEKKDGTRSKSSIIGFCEVAQMMSIPPPSPRDDDENDDNDGDDSNAALLPSSSSTAPTILNMVIAPNFRRRGIATNLVSSVQRYVRRTWGEQQLCLYVDKNNRQALSLYQRLGFVPSHDDGEPIHVAKRAFTEQDHSREWQQQETSQQKTGKEFCHLQLHLN